MIDQLQGTEGPVNTLKECLAQLPGRCEKYGIVVDDHVTLVEVRKQLVDRLADARRMYEHAQKALEIADTLLATDQIDEAKVAAKG